MNAYITSQQGWLILGFIAFLNVIGIIIFTNPEKLAFTRLMHPDIKKHFGKLWLFVCFFIDVVLAVLTAQGKYPFN